jgi:hypothetical protein
MCQRHHNKPHVSTVEMSLTMSFGNDTKLMIAEARHSYDASFMAAILSSKTKGLGPTQQAKDDQKKSLRIASANYVRAYHGTIRANE